MKRITKIAVALLLAVAVCVGFVPSEKVEAKSKNIYFSGEYQMKTGTDEYFILKTNQYSSPEGKVKGNFTIYYYYKPSGGMHPWQDGKMKRVGTNKYKSGKMALRVYKEKIVISNGGDYSGTYKLKKRYPKP